MYPRHFLAAAAALAAGLARAADAGDEDDEVALPELSLEHLLSAHTDRPMWWTTSRWA